MISKIQDWSIRNVSIIQDLYSKCNEIIKYCQYKTHVNNTKSISRLDLLLTQPPNALNRFILDWKAPKVSVLHEKFVEAVSNIVNYEPVCSLFIGNIIEDDPEIPETSGTYIGNFKNGYRDGTGTLITPENDKYIGEWELGKRIGKEICNYSDVSVYNGEWKDDLPHGNGKKTWANLDEYEGGFEAGLRSGFGFLIFEEQMKVYEGHWVNDKKQGQGKLSVKNEYIYEGEFWNDLPHNKGIQTFQNLDVYDGCFSFGKRKGEGIMRYANGDYYEGDWEDGLRWGTGVFVWKSGGLYTGEWKNDRQDGQGKLALTDRTMYIGTFINGLKDGYGNLTDDGKSYQGNWKEGYKHGFGIYEDSIKGKKYEGNWRSDKKHDREAKVIYRDGTVMRGEYKLGVKTGKWEIILPTYKRKTIRMKEKR